jgi:hypothetical protein
LAEPLAFFWDMRRQPIAGEHTVLAAHVHVRSTSHQSVKTRARGSQKIVTVCGEAQIGYSRPALGPTAKPENFACLDQASTFVLHPCSEGELPGTAICRLVRAGNAKKKL